MRVTNKYGLPEAIYRACVRDEHKQGDYSVTQLLKGATEIAYEKMFGSILEVDCSEMVNAIFGTAVHKIFENAETSGLSEHFMAVNIGGRTVTGKADKIENLKIIDYKTCATWKYIFKDFDDWKKQLIGYAYLYYVESGNMILNGEICAVFKDYSYTDAKRVEGYPKTQVVVIKFTWTTEDVMAVPKTWAEKIEKVESLIKNALTVGNLGECSAEECWAKPEKWALMKEGRKSAIKLYDTEAEAEEALKANSGCYIQYRAGECTKCLNYCTVAKNGLCKGAKHAEDVN